MATKTLVLCLLLAGAILPQGRCQHWSYGLNPGGKRDLDSLSDTLGNVGVMELIICHSFPHHWLPLVHFHPFTHIHCDVFFLRQLIEAFPHVDTPCTVFGCAEESPIARIYRSKGFLGSVTNRENGHIAY
ncbi:progonadoliberin-1-like [Cyclopterus lumpus]|uniref:progonadoliberin-1-like n=1 Tax=Cyclopterus lumpus TaxID=8103 RepID=UPI001486A312|nr:progonadoliberin-1-like [Cyclopterus lumpus]